MSEIINASEEKEMDAGIPALKGNIVPASLVFNYQELKDALNTRLEEYRKLVVTDDTLKGCRNAKSELSSLRNTLEKFRKDKKKEAEKPIKVFEDQIKELVGLVTEVEAPLNESLNTYTEKAREKKKAFAEKTIAEAITAYGLRKEFADRVVIKPEYLNISGTQKAVKEDVNAQADSLRKEQDAFDANIKAIKDTVERENASITIKMDPEIYASLYTSNRDLSFVLHQISTQAENIRIQEKKAEEERIRKEQERIELQRAAQEKAEQERQKRLAGEASEGELSSQAAGTGSFFGGNPFMASESGNPFMGNAAAEKPKDGSPMQPADNPVAGQNIPYPVQAPAQPSAPVSNSGAKLWRVTYVVTGTYETLWKLNEYINVNRIQKQILSQGPIDNQ